MYINGLLYKSVKQLIKFTCDCLKTQSPSYLPETGLHKGGHATNPQSTSLQKIMYMSLL
jgi:hypothetical protein